MRLAVLITGAMLSGLAVLAASFAPSPKAQSNPLPPPPASAASVSSVDKPHQSYVRMLPDGEVKSWVRAHPRDVVWIDAEMFEINTWVWRRVSGGYWIGEWTGAPKS